MIQDDYGSIVFSQDDLCHLYMKNPDLIIKHCLTLEPIQFHSDLELNNKPNLEVYTAPDIDKQEFDRQHQQRWYMPKEYLELDIAKWLLDQCTTDQQRQRVGEELLMYLDRDMFPLLQYLKYLVDCMRKYNIVWGVGRGSSVASYVLYLIGIHRVDSMYYDLSINEFLR